MPSIDNYWRRPSTRASRRALLRGGLYACAALSGTALLGCKTQKPRPASPTGAQAESSPRTGGTFNTYNTQNLGSLDPQVSSAASGAISRSSLVSFLFRFKTGPDPATYLNWEPEPDLAASIESPDGVTWTIKLRPNTRFHDVPPVNGHAVEADDVKATFQRAFSLTANQNRGIIGAIDPAQIETPDASTAVFKLRYAYGPFHSTLAGAGSEILPREALAGSYDPAKTIIGSGPFVYESYVPDVDMTFKRNAAWVESGRPYVDALHASIIADPAQALAQFTAGHLDELRPAPNDLATARQQNPAASFVKAATNIPYVFFGHMNHPSSPYADIRVRQALSMAVDRAALGKAIFNNDYSSNGVVAAALGKWMLPPEQFGDAARYYQYNAGEARKLVDAAPAAKQLTRLLYPVKQYGADIDASWEAINQMLTAVGFKMQLVPIDYNKDYIGGGTGVLFGNYPDDALTISPEGIHNNAETTFAINFESPGTGISKNLPQVSDPDLDAMIATMLTIFDDDARLKALQEAQRYAAAKLYIIPTPSKFIYTLVQPWVHGYAYSGSNVDGTGTISKLWIQR
jgi:ABC-type transport system substrate-binding protein